MKIVMGANNYGKSDVRLVKVFRDVARHEIKDLWVAVAMHGDFAAAHEDGNNSNLIATDTVRNTIYALAKDQLQTSSEEFAKVLVRHFVTAGPLVQAVTVTIVEHAWDRMVVADQAHDHAFTRGVGKHTVRVYGNATATQVESGIDDLYILKTTNSGWEGYLHEAFTTLPETNDRILATNITAKWQYVQHPTGNAVDYETVWHGVKNQILATFTDHYSPSVQNTLYRMGKAVLEAFPMLEKIFFSFPNKHHILYNLARFEMQNQNEIYHADAEPYGLIEGWVLREP